jgi:Fic family protein
MYKPEYRITPYLLKLIDEASALKSWIENATLKVQWLPALQLESRARGAHSTTSIEGNTLTLAQVGVISKGRAAGAAKDAQLEVENSLAAMKWVEKNYSDKINEPAVLKLHSMLTKGFLTDEKRGRYKDRQNYVKNEKGIVVYTPPSPKATPGLMKELIGWLNSKEAGELHSVMVCAIVHHRLVSIHPFSDGNGRLARLLGTWILYKRGYDIRHIFSLDDHFAKDRKFYYEKIEQARELDGILTYWIEYVAEGVIGTLKRVKARIEELMVSSGPEILLSPRQEELIRLLRDSGSLSTGKIIEAMKITRARVNQIIQPLVKARIVEPAGKARATIYRLAGKK